MLRLTTPCLPEVVHRRTCEDVSWVLRMWMRQDEESARVQRFYHMKDRRLAFGSLLLQRRVASWVQGRDFR